MELHFRYGMGVRPVHLQSGVDFEQLAPNPVPPLSDPLAAVRLALHHPTGTAPLRELARRGMRVAILVSDNTRPVRSEMFLPLLVAELNAAGVPDRDIYVVFALGNHRPLSREEQWQLVGRKMAARLRLFNHDCADQRCLDHIGSTSWGNEVWINRRVREADLVILTGQIIYHMIAGYSGGRKCLVPGVAGGRTITFNHRFILDDRCRSGILEGNPAHEDLLEACQLLNPAFLLNVVLTPRGEVARAVAGHYDLAHREGCKFVDQMYRVPIPAPYDVVIASAGGYPLDIDLRQAHKGLENAARALRPGGALLYFADCPEGAGRETIERWVRRYASSAEMAEALRRKFVFGGHKAYWLARLAERARIFLVSSLPDSLVRACRFVPVSDPEATLAAILAESSQAPRVALIPYASYTLPTLQGEELLSPARSRAEVDIRT